MSFSPEQERALAAIANEWLANEAGTSQDAIKTQAIDEAKAALEARRLEIRAEFAALLVPADTSLQKLRTSMKNAASEKDDSIRKQLEQDAIKAHEQEVAKVTESAEYEALVAATNVEIETLVKAVKDAESA